MQKSEMFFAYEMCNVDVKNSVIGAFVQIYSF